ncbi:hypothetical protein Taro_057008 [Colocasia esculenta]|uniref:Uncharacterized protein n=1 Tax=Colocasia esculenta TaxID=4460 RepID=A0A843XUW9_COLES|nr:hypothetical protein [Colocasia esculenta]
MVDTPLSKVRYSSPTLGHSAQLATGLSVGVSPRRAHAADFAGQVVSSGAASYVGQARLRKGFIGLVISAQSGEERLSSYLGGSRPILCIDFFDKQNDFLSDRKVQNKSIS